MKYIQVILTVLAVFIIAVSFLNPGGFLLAVAIAAVAIIVAVVVPFLREYLIAASKGKWAKSQQHDGRQREEQ